MRQMIVIDTDSVISAAVEATFKADTLPLLTARLGQQGLELSRSRRDAIVLGEPLTSTDLRRVADLAAHMECGDGASPGGGPSVEAHAGSRWARAVAPIAFAKRDPRTTEGWSREVYASPGTLRNWCRTAGVPTRRSLAFGRLLRAVRLCRDHAQKPENVLDFVDLRTLSKLLRSAGLTPGAELPRTIDEFLEAEADRRSAPGARDQDCARRRGRVHGGRTAPGLIATPIAAPPSDRPWWPSASEDTTPPGQRP